MSRNGKSGQLAVLEIGKFAPPDALSIAKNARFPDHQVLILLRRGHVLDVGWVVSNLYATQCVRDLVIPPPIRL